MTAWIRRLWRWLFPSPPVDEIKRVVWYTGKRQAPPLPLTRDGKRQAPPLPLTRDGKSGAAAARRKKKRQARRG